MENVQHAATRLAGEDQGYNHITVLHGRLWQDVLPNMLIVRTTEISGVKVWLYANQTCFD